VTPPRGNGRSQGGRSRAVLPTRSNSCLERDAQVRFLKRRAEYGELAMLSAKFSSPVPGAGRRVHGKLVDLNDVHWDERTFARSCAGCHTTGVDPKSHAFSAISLDCFTCHGIVDQKHAETNMVYLGKGRHDRRVSSWPSADNATSEREITKHGPPYPTNFVAGDNLFRDFHVRLTDADLRR